MFYFISVAVIRQLLEVLLKEIKVRKGGKRELHHIIYMGPFQIVREKCHIVSESGDVLQKDLAIAHDEEGR